MNEAYIIEGVRTPIGSFGGTLSSVRSDDMAALELNPQNKQYALATMCIGVGQGYAVVLERA